MMTGNDERLSTVVGRSHHLREEVIFMKITMSQSLAQTITNAVISAKKISRVDITVSEIDRFLATIDRVNEMDEDEEFVIDNYSLSHYMIDSKIVAPLLTPKAVRLDSAHREYTNLLDVIQWHAQDDARVMNPNEFEMVLHKIYGSRKLSPALKPLQRPEAVSIDTTLMRKQIRRCGDHILVIPQSDPFIPMNFTMDFAAGMVPEWKYSETIDNVMDMWVRSVIRDLGTTSVKSEA
jgi:hypothetical protein